VVVGESRELRYSSVLCLGSLICDGHDIFIFEDRGTQIIRGVLCTMSGTIASCVYVAENGLRGVFLFNVDANYVGRRVCTVRLERHLVMLMRKPEWSIQNVLISF